jgi:class 3 adenylate cyclase/tetratricopeptide (TPR) repeat protein
VLYFFGGSYMALEARLRSVEYPIFPNLGARMQQLADWLERLGLGQYTQLFADNGIDLSVLPDLTDQDLEKLGIVLGHRRKMLRAIADLAAASKSTPGETASDFPAGTFAPPKSYTQTHLAEQVATARGAIEGERKQVTVLFCDIANSTALAERIGAEAMHSLLNQFFEFALGELHRYECTINQFGGDGFMALAPVTHEDHARRAVLAAIAIQQKLPERRQQFGVAGAELAVRIGVNTGSVIVGAIGDNLRMDYTAIGDTTNLAARLQQHAPPDSILISENTYRLVRDDIQAEQLAPLAVKGKSEPVVSYKVLAMIPRRSPLRGLGDRALSGFVGRDRDLAQLLDLFAEARGSRGQVVGIVGEPGAGKSRLLYEFRQALGTETVTYLEGRCLSYGSSIPYVPVLDIVRQNFDLSEADREDAIAEKVRLGIAEIGLSADEWGPLLLLFLGVRQGTERLSALTPETIKARTFEMLRQFSLAGSKRQTLILAIEDLHWIDKTSEEYLLSLAENLSGAPIFVVSTYRPGYRPPLLEKSFASQMSLRPLSTADSLRVVHSAAEASSISEQLAKTIVEKADGNPLFLEELTRAVGDQPQEVISFVIPSTVQGVLQARIDRLASEPKRLLQAAAVIGREVPLPLLRAAWGASGSLDVHLIELKRQEFLYERGAGEQICIFKHALTQDVAYNSLLSPARQVLHEATGRALEEMHKDQLQEQYELLAYHYSQTTDNEKALEYLQLANQKAAKANAMQEAMTHFERAMAVLDGMPDTDVNRRRRISLIADQWIVFWLLFRVPEYYELLSRNTEIATRLGERNLLARFQLYLGHCQYVFGWLDQSNETCTNAAKLNEAVGSDMYAGAAYCMLQWNHFYLGNFEQGLACQEPALQKLRRHFDLRWYSWSLAAASLSYAASGRCGKAVQEAQNEIDTAAEYGDNSLGAFAHLVASNAYLYGGNYAKAIEHAQIAHEKAPTPADKAWTQTSLGIACCRDGRARKAVELLGAVAPMYDATRFVLGQVMASTYLGEAYLRAGEFDLAEQTLQKGLALAGPVGMKFYGACMRRLQGEVALAKNPLQVGEPFAEPHFESAITVLRDIMAEGELAMAYVGYGRLHKHDGRIAEARDYFVRALEIFERLGTLVEPDRVRAELAAL